MKEKELKAITMIADPRAIRTTKRIRGERWIRWVARLLAYRLGIIRLISDEGVTWE